MTSLIAHRPTTSSRRLPRPAFSPHFIVMGLLFAGAVLVGYLLLPDDNERVAMLERDGQDREALQILEQRFTAGDRSGRTLYQLQRLYEDAGNLTGARSMLERLSAARPKDGKLLRDLGELYRVTQDEAGYIRTLEARLALRFSQPVCKELIGLHRRAGRFDDEQRVLSHCAERGYRRNEDIIRLAHLTAVDGKLVEAARLLRQVDDRRQIRQDSDRIMLFQALLESGSADEAKRRAARWFKGSPDDSLVLQMIDTLAADGRHELALELAREVGRPGDSVSLAVAELMLDRREITAARIYLAGWLERAKLHNVELQSAELSQRAVRAALEAEDPGLALAIAKRQGLAQMQQEDLVGLAEALTAIGDMAAFREVRAELPDVVIRENLLLSAALEVERGKPEPARQLLARVEVDALDEWRLALWARLMTSTGRRAVAQQALRGIVKEEPQPGAAIGSAEVVSAPVPRSTAPASDTVRRATARRPGVAVAPTDPQAPPRLVRRKQVNVEGNVPRASRVRRTTAVKAKAKSPPPPSAWPVPVPFPQ